MKHVLAGDTPLAHGALAGETNQPRTASISEEKREEEEQQTTNEEKGEKLLRRRYARSRAAGRRRDALYFAFGLRERRERWKVEEREIAV